MSLRRLLALLLMTLSASTAHADERHARYLELRVEPLPRTLRMRAFSDNRAQEEPAEDSGGTVLTGPLELGSKGRLDRLRSARLEQDALSPPSPLSDRVVFRFNLGFGLDGGKPSGEEMLSGATLDETTNYNRLRTYGFGDAVLGSRGLGAQSLNTYLAANFRVDQAFPQSSSALPTVFDGSGVKRIQVRSAYAEADHFFEQPRLAPIYIRAGRMFKYGPAVTHFDGLTIGYDVPAMQLSIYGGTRSSLYGLQNSNFADEGQLSGTDLRIDLFEWRKWPLVVYANSLTFNQVDHFRTGLALRWSRNVLVGGDLRTLDGKRAQTRLNIRARLSEVTTVQAELSDRSRNDWSYGFLLLGRPQPGDPKPYLDLGPTLPRTHLTLRYGTVVLRNLDVLLRAAAALDRRSEDDPASSFSSSYFEGGGAVEVRVRRSLRVGTSITARQYALDDAPALDLVPGRADPLIEEVGSVGVRSFFEGGLNLHYSAGARTFSANAEFYGRLYRPRSPYVPSGFEQNDLRSGGRFGIEGWTFERVRLRGEYDVSFNQLLLAPELRGLKTLRVLMEGTF